MGVCQCLSLSWALSPFPGPSLHSESHSELLQGMGVQANSLSSGQGVPSAVGHWGRVILCGGPSYALCGVASGGEHRCSRWQGHPLENPFPEVVFGLEVFRKVGC